MSGCEITIAVALSPEQIAEQFWAAGSGGQRAFFAHLERIAGHKLCLQIAYVVSEMWERDDRDAINGFQTMTEHARWLVHDSTIWRHDDAKREIARMADDAKRCLGIQQVAA